jgi:hypothetical protein
MQRLPMRGVGLLLVLLAGCKEPAECSVLQTCAAGAYQFCKSGDACIYSLSDGTSIPCSTCGSCQNAVNAVNDWCGSSSQADMARVTTSVTIPKEGPAFTGQKTPPAYGDLSSCPDSQIEPNDTFSTALGFSPMPDQPTAKIIKLAICPSGNNPLAGAHDVDWYKIDYSGESATYHLVAQIFYDIQLGDLDLAVYDGSGNRVTYDGTSVSNGCAAATLTPGVYYVVVVGANHVDVGPYEILLKTYSAPQACPP